MWIRSISSSRSSSRIRLGSRVVRRDSCPVTRSATSWSPPFRGNSVVPVPRALWARISAGNAAFRAGNAVSPGSRCNWLTSLLQRGPPESPGNGGRESARPLRGPPYLDTPFPSNEELIEALESQRYLLAGNHGLDRLLMGCKTQPSAQPPVFVSILSEGPMALRGRALVLRTEPRRSPGFGTRGARWCPPSPGRARPTARPTGRRCSAASRSRSMRRRSHWSRCPWP